MVSDEKIKQAVAILVEAARPERIVLFGSYARGEPRDDSDVDLLVVETTIDDRYREMVRLRRLLSPLRIPVDIVIGSIRSVAEWANVPGTLFDRVRREGRVVYEKI